MPRHVCTCDTPKRWGIDCGIARCMQDRTLRAVSAQRAVLSPAAAGLLLTCFWVDQAWRDESVVPLIFWDGGFGWTVARV